MLGVKRNQRGKDTQSEERDISGSRKSEGSIPPTSSGSALGESRTHVCGVTLHTGVSILLEDSITMWTGGEHIGQGNECLLGN